MICNILYIAFCILHFLYIVFCNISLIFSCQSMVSFMYGVHMDVTLFNRMIQLQLQLIALSLIYH